MPSSYILQSWFLYEDLKTSANGLRFWTSAVEPTYQLGSKSRASTCNQRSPWPAAHGPAEEQSQGTVSDKQKLESTI